MCQRKTISWWEPSWAYREGVWRSFRDLVRPRFIARVLSISLLLFAAIVVGCKIAFPALPLGFLWKAPFVLLQLALAFVAMFLLMWFIPPHITVHKDYIHRIEGHVHSHYKMANVKSVRIVIFATNRIRLRIFADEWTRALGVSSKMKLDELCSFFPTKPQVWDARERFQAMRRKDRQRSDATPNQGASQSSNRRLEMLL